MLQKRRDRKSKQPPSTITNTETSSSAIAKLQEQIRQELLSQQKPRHHRSETMSNERFENAYSSPRRLRLVDGDLDTLSNDKVGIPRWNLSGTIIDTETSARLPQQNLATSQTSSSIQGCNMREVGSNGCTMTQGESTLPPLSSPSSADGWDKFMEPSTLEWISPTTWRRNSYNRYSSMDSSKEYMRESLFELSRPASIAAASSSRDVMMELEEGMLDHNDDLLTRLIDDEALTFQPCQREDGKQQRIEQLEIDLPTGDTFRAIFEV